MRARPEPLVLAPRRSERGFTLVELMIAIALMLVITLQLQIIFNGSRIMFSKAEALVEVFQNARNALDLMERDFANAIATDQMDFFADRPGNGSGHYQVGEELTELRQFFFNDSSYVHSFAAKQYEPYQPKNASDGGPYRRDAVYFKTFTAVNGVMKEALVEYSLFVGRNPESNPRTLPILQRRLVDIAQFDAQGRPILNVHDSQDVCYFVQEFKVEAFFRDRSKGYVGRFYSPREAVLNGQPPAGDRRPPLMRNFGGAGVWGYQCVEVGAGQLTRDGKFLVTTTWNSPQSKLQALVPGSKLYLVSEPIPPANNNIDFGYVTIKQIDRISQPGQVLLQFEEGVQILGKFPASLDTLGCNFRGSFLPSAVRLTLKIKDAKSSEFRTLVRTMRVGS